MKVVTLEDIPHMPVEGAEPIEGWTGPVSRSRQTIIQPGDSANYNCSVVNFSQGCTTGWHTHTCDQLLVVTSGSGMVATEHEQREINVGDVVHYQGRRTPLAWRQGRYDDGAYHGHTRWQSSHTRLISKIVLWLTFVAAGDRGDQECEGEQFALDSHSQLGPIRRANQGVFEIMGRDTAGDAASTAGEAAPTDDQASIAKKVRLVSTVDYYLIN